MTRSAFLFLCCSILLTACGGKSSSSGDDSIATQPDRALTQPSAGASDVTETTADTEEEDESPAPPLGAYTRPLDYPYMVTLPLQFITLSTGKQLGVKVTVPANERGVPADGKFPTILVQSAYNINMVGAVPMPGGTLTGAPDPYMVRRGYILVSVDVVGTGVSQGGWEMLGPEEQAGYGETVDWVLQQPWCNGKLGLAGLSYMGITALFTAEQRPEVVNAVFASVPMGDPLRGTVGTGGMLNGVFMSFWLKTTQILTVQNVLAVLQNLPFANQITGATREHTEQIDKYYIPVIERSMNGDPELTYDNEFWRVRSPLEKIDRIQAPTFVLGATHDIFQRDEPLLYEKLKQNVDSRLVIYNGDHIGHFGQAYLGAKNVNPLPSLILQWFDRYLKGIDSGIEQIPPVTQYVKNSPANWPNGFATTTDWPHPQALPERWYLHSDFSLTKTAPVTEEETNSMTPPPFPVVEYGKSKGGGMLIFDVEPGDGTKCSVSYQQWTLGAAGILKAPRCFYDNYAIEKDALNYETEPMDEDYYINGPIQADIWLETSAREAVLSVRVDEVSPNGRRVLPLSNGLLLASARAVDVDRSRFMQGEMIQPYHYFTQDAELPVVPGEVMKMQVEIFSTSALIRKGYRLRVSLAPSNDAQGVLNLPRQELAKDGVTRIHHSPDHPSSLVVPVVPLSALD